MFIRKSTYEGVLNENTNLRSDYKELGFKHRDLTYIYGKLQKKQAETEAALKKSSEVCRELLLENNKYKRDHDAKGRFLPKKHE